MHQVEENIRNINKWAYIVDIVNINDIHHNTIYLHGIIVLHASHDEDWLHIHISPLCTYTPLDIHPDQWVTIFNNNINNNNNKLNGVPIFVVAKVFPNIIREIPKSPLIY
jgi:hypothetical protein